VLPGQSVLGRKKDNSLLQNIQNLYGVHPFSSTVGIWGCFVGGGVKHLKHGGDQSPIPTGKVKNVWSLTSCPAYVYMAWWFIEHGDRYTFTFALK